MWPTPVGGLHRLTINDSCTWRGEPPRLNATTFPQYRHDPFPHSFIPKPRKIAIDGGARWVLSRQHAPSTPSSQDVKDGVEHRTHIGLSWASTWLLRRNQRFENGPFFVGEIRGIHFHQL